MPTIDGWAICTPQNGVVLALLLKTRRRLWPWIVLGYVVALSQGMRAVPADPHIGTLGIFGNLAEVGIAAFALPPYRSLKQWLQERRLLPAFLGYAMLLGPVLMAAATALRVSAASAGNAGLDVPFWGRVRTIAFAEALGMALATSLVLVLLNQDTYALFRWRALPQTVALFCLSAGTTWVIFEFGASSSLLLAPLAVLVVLAFRLGLRGAILGLGISCATAVGYVLREQQSLSGVAHGSPALLAANVQTCFALAILVILPLGVTLANKRYLEDRLGDAHGELDRLKSLDRLTGVPNRKRFDLVLDREWQRAVRDPKPVALLMVEVDDFDLYQEHYGPQAGDECLRLVAAKMAGQPHRVYDLVSRFDGGKFTVLLPGAPGEAVDRIAEEFRAEIAGQEWPHQWSPFERITVSVGWAAMVPAERSSPDALIAAAESALLLAKENGKNRVEGFNPSAALNPTA
jgi:diguanylate cyclase (GGDEF)-like protein